MKVLVVDINGTPHRIPICECGCENESVLANFDIFARQSNHRYSVLGSNDGDLFDPLDIGNNIHKRDKERGGMFWKLRKCSQECYRDYTAFLRSKNRTPFFLAQRRFRNDF